MKQKQPEVKARMPDAAQKEIVKEIGALWSAMSAEEKAPFKELADADKQRHTVRFAVATPDFCFSQCVVSSTRGRTRWRLMAHKLMRWIWVCQFQVFL